MRKISTQLIFIVNLIAIFLLSACQAAKPTYTKEKATESIVTLTKKEYSLETKSWIIGETLWVYVPLPRLLDEEKQWDKEILQQIDKARSVSTRVILSMMPRPQFLICVASDTEKIGIDYFTVTLVEDLVKYQMQVISRDDFYRRNVIRVEENTAALADKEGGHLVKGEMLMPDFLAEQMAQRVFSYFEGEKYKQYFKVDSATGSFHEDTFVVEYSITQLKPPPQAINIKDEVLRLIRDCLKTYSFKGFSLVEVADLASQDRSVFSKATLLAETRE